MAWHEGYWWPLYCPQWYFPGVNQHMFDPYSFTHLLHGMVGFYIFLGILHYAPKLKWIRTPLHGFWILFSIEFTWELVENSEFIINRYRNTSGTSKNYEGDSYQNIIGDLIACQTGYGISWIFSHIVPVGLSGILNGVIFLTIELCLLLYMRDCFTLCFYNNFYKIEFVYKWQTEGVENAMRIDGIHGVELN